MLFLDVQMPGMDGFDVLDALSPSTCPTVVFVTAYDQYALQAFNVHAADYLLKPFDRKRLHHALVRVRGAGGRQCRSRGRSPAQPRGRRPDKSLLRADCDQIGEPRVFSVRAADVDRIQASGHYLTLHVGREEHVIRGTIREVAARLHPDRFVRVHRSTIVNLDRIKELIPTFHGDIEIVLRDGDERDIQPRLLRAAAEHRPRNAGLVVSQHHEGVDSRGSQRRKERGAGAGDDDQEYHGAVGDGIGNAPIVTSCDASIADVLRLSIAPDGDTDGRQPHGLHQHAAGRAACRVAERHPNPDLLRSHRDKVREHAIDARSVSSRARLPMAEDIQCATRNG